MGDAIRKTNSLDMTEGSIWKQLLEFALPMALGYPVGWILCGVLLFVFVRKTVLYHPEQGKEVAHHE